MSEVDKALDKTVAEIKLRYKRYRRFQGRRNRGAWNRMNRESQVAKVNRGMQKIMNLVNHGVPVVDSEIEILKEEAKHFPRGHETIYGSEFS